jgi:hypothetical protein
MKFYSDTLTPEDFRAALSVAAGLGLEEFTPLTRPKLRRHGWNLRLSRAGSRRPFSSGQSGATGAGAASWADYGWFIAALYKRDPGMQAGSYKDRDDFHAKTEGAFRPDQEYDNETSALTAGQALRLAFLEQLCEHSGGRMGPEYADELDELRELAEGRTRCDECGEFSGAIQNGLCPDCAEEDKSESGE